MRQRRQELHTTDLTEDSEGHPANIWPMWQYINTLGQETCRFPIHHGVVLTRELKTWVQQGRLLLHSGKPQLQERGPVRPTFHLCREARNLSLGEKLPSFQMSASRLRTKHLQAGSQTHSGKVHSRTRGALQDTKEISEFRILPIAYLLVSGIVLDNVKKIK